MAEELIELTECERDIYVRFTTGGKAPWGASPKGEWIRCYLMERGPASIYDMWKAYQRFASILGIRPGTYNNFKTYIWILKRLGLVRVVRRAPGSRGGFRKAYYAIVPGMEFSPLWRRPVQTLYPKTDWSIPEHKVKYRAKYR